ncbi:MAG: YraN family protein [Calditrichaeota bacterium]|nr:YraN family protein [Calditrichota bacterium]
MNPCARDLGKRGEELAADFLRRRGYQVLEERVHVGHDEIDLVVQQGETLVFVEVKTARSRTFGEPEGWVTPRKQKRLVRAAERFLSERGFEDRPCRFDVVTVRFEGASTRISHIADAFRPWDLEENV